MANKVCATATLVQTVMSEDAADVETYWEKIQANKQTVVTLQLQTQRLRWQLIDRWVAINRALFHTLNVKHAEELQHLRNSLWSCLQHENDDWPSVLSCLTRTLVTRAERQLLIPLRLCALDGTTYEYTVKLFHLMGFDWKEHQVHAQVEHTNVERELRRVVKETLGYNHPLFTLHTATHATSDIPTTLTEWVSLLDVNDAPLKAVVTITVINVSDSLYNEIQILSKHVRLLECIYTHWKTSKTLFASTTLLGAECEELGKQQHPTAPFQLPKRFSKLHLTTDLLIDDTKLEEDRKSIGNYLCAFGSFISTLRANTDKDTQAVHVNCCDDETLNTLKQYASHNKEIETLVTSYKNLLEYNGIQPMSACSAWPTSMLLWAKLNRLSENFS